MIETEERAPLPRVGGDVEGYCGSCRGMREHRILATVVAEIVKTECRDCRAQHGHRPRPPLKKTKGAFGNRVKKDAPALVKKVKEAPSAPPPVFTRLEIRKQIDGDKILDYHPAVTFAPGDAIHTDAFGLGIVRTVAGPRAVEVDFAGKRRRMAHAMPRPPSRLGYHQVVA